MSHSVGLGGGTGIRGMSDILDTSLSFQIPTGGLGDDYLLEDDDSFLKGADNIPATPAPTSRVTLEPLTINDLTPRPSKPTLDSLKTSPKPIRSRSPPTDAHRTPPRRTSSRTKQSKKSSALSRVSQEPSILQSPRGERIDSLRAELGSLAEELSNNHEPSEPDVQAAGPSKQKLRRREGSTQRKESAKPTVVREGGIAKARPSRGTRRTSITNPAAKALVQETLTGRELPPLQPPAREPPIPETHAKPDPSVGSETPRNVVSKLEPRQGRLNAHVPTFPKTLPSQAALDEPNHTNQAAADRDVVGFEITAVPVTADQSPLTISRLSPHKSASTSGLASASADDDVAVENAFEVEASLRTSAKRPVSVEDSGEVEGARPRKKSKLDPSASSSSTVPSSSKHVASALLTTRQSPSRKSIRKPSSSGSGSRSTVARRKSNGKATTRVNRAGNSTSRSAPSQQKEREGSRSRTGRGLKAVDQDDDQNSTALVSNHPQNCEEEPRAESSHRNQDHWESHEPEPLHESTAPTRVTRSSSRLGSRSGSTSSKPKVNIVAATIPVGFRFSVDARLEARSRSTVGESVNTKAKSTSALNKGKGKAREVETEGVRTRSAVSRSHGGFPNAKRSIPTVEKNLYSVPDFKSLHASNNAALARKRQKAQSSLQPTVPVAPRFATDVRLKERHMFEEKVKEKERREQKEREAMRRQEEQEQEKQLREMRKRAVPKAHEVPEWYKDAPKKAK